MQLTVLSTHYSINDIVISELMLVFIIAITGLFIGIKLQSKINDKSYHALIKGVLAISMVILIYQGGIGFLVNKKVLRLRFKKRSVS
jgi:uncharacterized transporter YbjL